MSECVDAAHVPGMRTCNARAPRGNHPSNCTCGFGTEAGRGESGVALLDNLDVDASGVALAVVRPLTATERAEAWALEDTARRLGANYPARLPGGFTLLLVADPADPGTTEETGIVEQGTYSVTHATSPATFVGRFDDLTERAERCVALAEFIVRGGQPRPTPDPATTATASIECDWCEGKGCNVDGACGRCDKRGRVPATPLGQSTVDVRGFGAMTKFVDGENFPDAPYAIRLEANRPLSDEEIKTAARALGYAYRSTVAGESLSDPTRDSSHSFALHADTTKSRRDDLGVALDDFHETLPGTLRDGSPVRTTDRAGRGTKGTRLTEGLNDPDLTFEIYYDSVV